MKDGERTGRVVSLPQRKQSTGEVVVDGVITAKVRSQLMMDSLTNGYSIHVTTLRGSVRLDGYVESDAVRQRALKIAAEVDGVQQVEDLLDVRV